MLGDEGEAVVVGGAVVEGEAEGFEAPPFGGGEGGFARGEAEGLGEDEFLEEGLGGGVEGGVGFGED